MYEVYYNLKRIPFIKDIDPHHIFISQSIAELNRRLEYIKQKRGIMLITGEAGCGKTLSIRAFITKKSQLFTSIQNTIKHYVENAKKIPVIIFDEAHYLKNENFYELQIITNFNIDSTDPAIFILLAQPHLRDRLMRPIHQSFNQRITLKFHLASLSKEETNSYIQHQLKYASAPSRLFETNALAAIYQASNGNPRVINSVATNCLILGALEKKDSITEEEVYRAVKETG
jgi:type II secretory pathway predicted ATPase ExeA